MNNYLFSIKFICANTGNIKTIQKEYRANTLECARIGLNSYLETNKTIHSALDTIFIKQL